jgi:putative endonuclease
MYYTYVLLCRGDKNFFYIGYCRNIDKRVKQHIEKAVKYTKRFREVKLVYCEMCLNKTDARKRELQLKTGFGRGYLKRRLENYINSRISFS